MPDLIQTLALMAFAALMGLASFFAWRRLAKYRAISENARQQTAEWLARNPETPALTEREFEEFQSWHAAQAVPAVRLDIDKSARTTAGGSRLGGSAWLGEGETWPCGRDGRPLLFLAQIDFSDLPQLPGFPGNGLLQFFIGQDDLFGANFDDPTASNIRVIWREDLSVPGHLTAQPDAEDADCSPMSEQLRGRGVGLNGVLVEQSLPLSNWTLEEQQPRVMQSASADAVWNYVEAQEAPMREKHHVGGYPEFTQSDFRSRARFGQFDRVLLQLWSYPHGDLTWGDVGQAHFMIARADLIARDFSRIAFHWDCT